MGEPAQGGAAAGRGVDLSAVETPALLVSAPAVEANIGVTIALLDGTGVGWRPHVKTAKLAWTMGRLLGRGVRSFKCATARELEALCELGADDVLVAFPHGGANAERIVQIAEGAPSTRVSAIVDHPEQLPAWRNPVSLFVDVDVGMGRGGVRVDDHEALVALIARMRSRGLLFRGLHVYDGHLNAVAPEARESVLRAQLEGVVRLLRNLDREGIEVVTSGTPTFALAACISPFAEMGVKHAVGPGTVVYADLMSIATHPHAGFRPAATVLARVVSTTAGRVIADAGSKAVSADAGVPTCRVSGRPELVPLRPSEEHLPVEAPPGTVAPGLGEVLELIPRHVCTTVHLYDEAILVGTPAGATVVPVTARGRGRQPVA